MLIVSLSLGLLLIGATGSSWLAARQLTDTVAKGQGEGFVSELVDILREAHSAAAGPPGAEELEAALEERAAQGLRYICIKTPSGEVVMAVGTSDDSAATDAPANIERKSNTLTRSGEIYRLTSTLPAPEGGGPRGKGGKSGKAGKGGKGGKGGKSGEPPPPDGSPPDGSPPDGSPPDGSPPDGPMESGPVLILEFEPLLSQAMEFRAARNFAIGLAGALVLSLAAGVFWRMSMKAEADAARMERQRTLATLGEMSAVLAHELRNPLASLKGHAQLLVERLPEGGKDRKKAQRVVDETVRIEVLTNDLLTFVRSGRVELRAVDPAELLWSSADAVDPERIDMDLDDAPESWRMDPPRMQQVLINLLQNALQVSPEGARVEARVAARGGRLEWTVRDRGPGIPEDALARIFEPFFTTKTKGTGLGLAVSRQIVEAHGGRIEASNHPEGGAEFRVCIPGGA